MDKRLMVGDWIRVQTTNGARDVQVRDIDVDGWVIYDHGVAYNYEPITITDDYLVDVGFTERKLIGLIERFTMKDKGGKVIMAMDNHETHFLCLFKVGANVGGIVLHYVHEFQHLCHLLKVELTPQCYD